MVFIILRKICLVVKLLKNFVVSVRSMSVDEKIIVWHYRLGHPILLI